jgi:VWFA-related protein
VITRRLRSWRAVVAAVVVSVLAPAGRLALRAQAQAPPPGQPSAAAAAGQPSVPRFRGGLDRVTVDTIVVDKDGAPVRDLTVNDFRLEVDGKPRRLQSAELVTFDRPDGAAGAGAVGVRPTETSLPEVSSNDGRIQSRLVLVVVDRESIKPSDSPPFMQAGVEFVKQLTSTDRVGLLGMPEGPRIDFTRDHQRVAQALGGILGSAPEQGEPPPRVSIREAFEIERNAPGVFASIVERECERPSRDPNIPFNCPMIIRERARTITLTVPALADARLQALRRVLDAFSRVEGPKAVVLLSQGIPHGDTLPPLLTEIGRTAARAAISFYAIQVFRSTSGAAEGGQPMDLEADRRMMSDSLANLTGVTGGALLQPTGRIESAFQRIARELSARYVLSFDSEPEDRDGKPHRIELTMTREATRLLRYRREFAWTPPAPEASAAASSAATTAATTAATDPRQTLGMLLASGDIRSELPVQISAFTNPQLSSPGQKTTLWIHLGTGTGTGTRAGAVSPATVRFEVFNEQNVRVVSDSKTIDAPASSGAPATGASAGLDHMAALALPAGRYVARVAAQDATGKIGTAEHLFDARLAGTSDLQAGSLMLLDERSIEAGRPTPLRAAGDAPAFHAYLELQATGTPAWNTVQGSLEIVDATDGHVRATAPLSLRETKDSARQIAEAIVPIAGWTAGTYLVRASIARANAPVATAIRTLVVEYREGPRMSGGDPSPPAGTAVAVEEAVAVGARFVTEYVDRSTSVVAEEHYVQIIRRGPADPARRDVDEALEWHEDNWIHPRTTKDPKLRRQMISDVLMVKTNDGLWTNFRDVGTLDGKELKDRSKRALALFTQSGTDVGAGLRRIADESSRLNLGGGGNFNVPALPLQVLHATHRDRFTFGTAGTETIDGVTTTILTYRETKTPTFIRSIQKNEPVYISGKLWIVPEDGRVLRSEMTLHDEPNRLSTLIVVNYRRIPELDMLMPVEMWERWTPDQPLANYFERRARYANYRRFNVTTSESPNGK